MGGYLAAMSFCERPGQPNCVPLDDQVKIPARPAQQHVADETADNVQGQAQLGG